MLLHIEDVELDGVRTAQAVFDGYTDKKDADFIKEPRVRQAQTKEDTRDAILNVLAESRLGSMASPQLKSEVMREIGCSEGTYNRAYGELVKSGKVTKHIIRQRDGRNKWYSSLYCSETSDKVQIYYFTYVILLKFISLIKLLSLIKFQLYPHRRTFAR